MPLVMFLWVLVEFHDATQEELDVFSKELSETADHVVSGRIKLNDIVDTLRDDYNCTIECGKMLKKTQEVRIP